jgi:hypothetical protein
MGKENYSLIRNFWEWWKRVGRRIGDFQARFLLVFFYFIVVAPFALVVRSSDPLSMKAGASRGWQSRENTVSASVERARRQF